MASRIPSTADPAIPSLKAAIPTAYVGFLVFGLASLRAAKATADEFLERDAPGYTGFEQGDDIELQASNGTGHFALALPLLRHHIFPRHARPRRRPLERGAPRRTEPDFPYLKELNQPCSTAMNRTGTRRRVSGGPIYALSRDGDCLSSNGWRGTPVWMRPSVAGRAAVFSGGSTRRGLKSTPSWNPQDILSTNELQRRLAGTGICYCLSWRAPAGTHASYPWLTPFSFLEKYASLSPEQGARTQLYAPTALEVEEKDLRWVPINHIPYTTHAKDIFTTVGSSARKHSSVATTRPTPRALSPSTTGSSTDLQRAIILIWVLGHRPDLIGYDAQDTARAHHRRAVGRHVCEALREGGPSASHVVDENVEPEGRHTLPSEEEWPPLAQALRFAGEPRWYLEFIIEPRGESIESLHEKTTPPAKLREI
ncbi:hypothetical protein B0H14DRAFT_3494359 [Mycena olivaceomarginata]|nr:hypothetical protein B0H14DRAFT_3494359 [Mycena olivaceomarginata]